MTRITSRKEEPVHDSAMRAQRLDAAERLGVGLVHDLNNLLSAIMGHFDLEEQGDSPDSETERMATREEIRLLLARGKELTQRFLSLVDDPSSYVRQIDLGSRVGKLMLALRYALRRKVVLEMDLYPAPLEVRIDPCQLDQILLNLVFNANDAMPEGGRLSVRTRPEGPHALLEVEDGGLGIDPKLRERVFDPYFTTKPEGEGTGIGLAICRRIAERAGGTLELEPGPVRGTIARLKLPLSDGSSGER